MVSRDCAASFRLAVTVALVVAGLVSAPLAAATPGQCWSSPFGGFCDELPYPTDYSFDTPC